MFFNIPESLIVWFSYQHLSSININNNIPINYPGGLTVESSIVDNAAMGSLLIICLVRFFTTSLKIAISNQYHFGKNVPTAFIPEQIWVRISYKL